MKRTWLVLVFFLFISAARAEVPPYNDYQSIPEPLKELFSLMGGPRCQDVYLHLAMQPMTNYGGSEQIVNQQTLETARKNYVTRQQVRRTGKLLGADLDLDGILTAEELLLVTHDHGLSSNSPEGVKKILEIFDKDNNGSLTYREIRDQAILEGEARWEKGEKKPISDLLSLSPKKDGQITAAQLNELAVAAFHLVDKDGNNCISEKEFRQLIGAPPDDAEEQPVKK